VRTSTEVRCWGYLVPGLPTEPATRLTPERITELDGAVAIVGNRNRLCALMPGATARCAGIEQVPTGKYDVHGYPFHAPRPSMSEIEGLTGIEQLAVGVAHVCALLSDGTVRCWGNNAMGELGDGTRQHRTSPVAVAGLASVVEIASGMAHTCARLADGGVHCWGGRGDSEGLALETIAGVAGATQIACGWSHSCARISDGTLRCWGSNESGQLGDGTREKARDRTHAKVVAGLSNASGVALGDNHSCARLADGALACWGDNTYGEIGPSAPDDVVRVEHEGASTFRWKERYRAAIVPGIRDVVDVALGAYISCTRTKDGSAYCFGRNDLGQVGPRERRELPEPWRIPLD